MVVGNTLYSYYQENLMLVRNGFALEAVDNMIPYEKEIYLTMIKKMKGSEQ